MVSSIIIFLIVAGLLYGIFAYPRGGAAGLGHDLSTGCFTLMITLLGFGLIAGGGYLLVVVGGPIGAIGIGLVLVGGIFVKIMWEEAVKRRR